MTYAIFSEWTRDEDVRQDLFVPSINLGAKILAPTLWTREISGRGRRKWNAVPNPTYHPTAEEPSDQTDLLQHEVNQFEGISNWMISVIGDPAWDLRAAFPVLVTTTDLLWFSDKPTTMSADLNERITALRNVKGLPDIGNAKVTK
jgi:hypothetical protein